MKKILTPKSEFSELVGRHTSYWSYVKSPKDFEILEALKTVYDQNCAFQYNAPSQYKVPKVVHCIWLGPRPFPQQSVENMRTWVALHPNWKFIFWTDRPRLPPCQGFEVRLVEESDFDYLKSYYDRTENWGEKADYLRYEILYRDGGVYIDHDANALQAFDQLNCAYDFYGCTEAPHPPIVDMAVTVGNGLIGVRPYHPILKGCLDYVACNWAELEASGLANTTLYRPKLVMQRSYIALTRSILDNLNRDGNCDIVFPASYFFASKQLPSFYSHHFYATAWNDEIRVDLKEKIYKSFKKEQKRNNKIRMLCQIVAGFELILVLLALIFVVRRYANN